MPDVTIELDEAEHAALSDAAARAGMDLPTFLHALAAAEAQRTQGRDQRVRATIERQVATYRPVFDRLAE